MASAASIQHVWGLTPTKHQTVPDYLAPQLTKLPNPFVVCVIGASRGIGEETAYSYAKAGASEIVIAARSVNALQTVAEKIKTIKPDCGVHVEKCDLGSNESVEALAKTIASKLGRLDVVIVNGGYAGEMITDITKNPAESFRTATEVNFLGTFYTAHHFIPLLLNSKDGAKHFIAIGSIALAMVSGPMANAQYNVTKAAQLKLVEHIHEQFAEKGLLALCVHPGAVLTEMAKSTKGAEEIIKSLSNDSADLCGAVCVWLAKENDRRSWLGGRLLCSIWDMKELEQRRDEIVEKDLLKMIVTT